MPVVGIDITVNLSCTRLEYAEILVA
jgi:hypothetical protein